MTVAPPPLAFDRAGDPIAIDANAAFFRVVHARAGSPMAVQDLDGGGALFVSISCSPSELRERSGVGSFTLIQVDENRITIEKADRAYVEILPEKPKPKIEENALTTAFNQLTTLLLKSQEEQRAVMRELSGAVTAVTKINTEALEVLAKLATGQPIRELEVVQHHVGGSQQPPQADAVQKALEVFGPMIMQLGPLAVAWLRKKVGEEPLPQAQLAAAGVQS